MSRFSPLQVLIWRGAGGEVGLTRRGITKKLAVFSLLSLCIFVLICTLFVIMRNETVDRAKSRSVAFVDESTKTPE